MSAGDSEAVAREFCSLRLCWSELAIARFFYVRGWLTISLDSCDALCFLTCVKIGRYTAREKYPEALRILADDVYHSSIAYGPESSRTAGGYYLMADVFDKYGDTDTSTVGPAPNTHPCCGRLFAVVSIVASSPFLAHSSHFTCRLFRCRFASGLCGHLHCPKALRNKVAQIWRKSLSVVVEASRAGEEDAPTLQPLEIAAAQNQLIGLIGNYADLELTENEGQVRLPTFLAMLLSTEGGWCMLRWLIDASIAGKCVVVDSVLRNWRN